ncbi:hypothetical protein OF83DRAFT_804844 [Amylostereum chailletii]|nr:hypothetical protein OF83DRAFT_804844 [Amylostereum chailletii]
MESSPSPDISQAALALPTPAMQDQIHELAKSLPPPRKQNIACDACRQRKVKCHQVPGQLKCQHCTAKNYPCTHHAQLATTEKKRLSSATRRPRSYSANQQKFSQPDGMDISTKNLSAENIELKFTPTPSSSSDADVNGFNQGFGTAPAKDWGALAYMLDDDNYRIQFALDLVEVYFQIVHTRLPFLNPSDFRARLNVNLSQTSSSPPAGSSNQQFISSEHAQYAAQFHSSPGPSGSSPYSSPYSTPGPVESPHPALIAAVIAWGAKFSDHDLLKADRAASGTPQSALAKELIIRAREIAEAFKVHRIPKPEHVVIALLIEPLQRQIPEDITGFRGFWLSSAIRQLFDLQINHKSVITSIRDPEARGTMIFAWWMSCLSDAYGSAYYRRKPQVEDADYDVDFYTADPVPLDPDGQTVKADPREHLEFLGYYRAAHALARISRHMSKNLWIPSTDSEGVPIDVLREIMQQLNEWRIQYLPHVGVPTNFAAEWDFVSAVSACASDATFHIMWIILFNALDDYGLRELNVQIRSPSSTMIPAGYHHIEDILRKVLDEALHGASRIAGLAGVLTKNGYLRLDPAVMHVSCSQAGTLLARFGRPEVKNCIEGLEQYSHSYEEAAEQAIELRRLFAMARSGESEFNHMTCVVHPPAPVATPSPQVVQDAGGMYVSVRGF